MSKKDRTRMSGAVALAEMCGAELAKFLRQRHPKHTEEFVKRDFESNHYEVDGRTVKSWLAGNWPIGRHLTALINIYGVPFVKCFTAPALTSAEDQTIEQELAELESQIKRIRAKQAEVLRQLGRDVGELAQAPRPSAGGREREAGDGEQGPCRPQRVA